MPDFWQFPTVSMGLGPIMAIYQARFMKYLTGRGIADTERPQGVGLPRRRRDRRAGVARRDLPRGPRAASTTSSSSSTATCSASTARCAATARSSRSSRRSSAARAGTSSRSSGARAGIRCSPPTTRACSCSAWTRPSTASTRSYKARDGAFVREHFFGADPKLREMVAHMSDDEVWALNRGGHDPKKIYAAYAAASAHTGPADGDPRQDHQGLRDGRGRRGPEHHPPAEEDGRGRAAEVARPLRPDAHRRAGPRRRRSSSPPTTRPR